MKIERGRKRLRKANMELTGQGTHREREGDKDHRSGTHLTHGLAGASIHLSLSSGPTTAARTSRSATTLLPLARARFLHIPTYTTESLQIAIHFLNKKKKK